MIDNSYIKVFSFSLLLIFLSLKSICCQEKIYDDSLNIAEDNWFAYPYLFYTPETKFAFGGGGVYFFRESEQTINDEPSKILLSSFYTTRKQYLIEIVTELYFNKAEYFCSMNLLFMKFPLKFFGIGNNTNQKDEENYTNRKIKFSLNLQKKIFNAIKAGIIYEYNSDKILDKDKGLLLSTNLITGANGGSVSGLGAVATWDTRDNIVYPSTGEFFTVSGINFNKFLGSEYTFSRFIIDFRKFIVVNYNQILAFQLFGTFMSNNPPFYLLSQLGGQYVLRGYHEGRFRDKNYVAAQVEYRMPLWWRFGIVGFTSSGDVMNSPNHLTFTQIKYSFGAGLRFKIEENEDLNLRIDFGFGKNSTGVYIGIGEAF